MMTVAEILSAARRLYAASPSHAPAEEYPDDGECPLTALTAVGDLYSSTVAAERVLEVAMYTEMYTVAEWNAEHTTEEVLAAFDRAIAAEEAKA